MKKSAVLTTLIIVLTALRIEGAGEMKGADDSALKIAIVFNNCVSDTCLAAGPGFAAWITFNGRTILFDTGSDYSALLDNIQKMKLDHVRLTDVFISHNHWDHVYGLPAVMGMGNSSLNIYVPQSSAESIMMQMPRLKITGIDSLREVYPKIWTTGEMTFKQRNTMAAEQVLVLDHDDGLIVLTGCAHPGIERIVNCVKGRFRGKGILLLAGGFHLEGKSTDEIKILSDTLKGLGVQNIAPSHCTGESAVEFFKKEWGNRFVRLFLGDAYVLE